MISVNACQASVRRVRAYSGSAQPEGDAPALSVPGGGVAAAAAGAAADRGAEDEDGERRAQRRGA